MTSGKLRKLALVGEDRACWTCRHYCFKHRETGGWAYCKFHKKWFPGQGARATGTDSTPPGMRSCENWKEK